MKYKAKHSKRSKAKKYIINSVTIFMAVICMFSLCALDSESWLPLIMFMPSFLWCMWYAAVNFKE